MPETPTPNDSDLPADFDASADEQSPTRPGVTPKAFVLRKQSLPDFNDRLKNLAQTPAPKVPTIKELRSTSPFRPSAPEAESAPPPPPPEPVSEKPAAAPEVPKRVLRPRPEMRVRSSGLPSLKDYAKVLDAPLPPADSEPEQPVFPETPAAPSPEPVSYPKPISYGIPSSPPPAEPAPKPALPPARPVVAKPVSPVVSPALAPVPASDPVSEKPVSPAAAPARDFKLRGPLRAPGSPAPAAESAQSAAGLKLPPSKSPEGPVSLPPRDPSDDSALFDAVVDANFSFVEETPPPPPSASSSPAAESSAASSKAKPESSVPPASGGRMAFKSRVEKTDSTPSPAPVAPPPPPPAVKPASPSPLPGASETEPAKPRLGLRTSGADQSQSAQRISLPRQTDERTKPAGKPLHEQFDLNSLVAGEDGPTPAAELPPPPPGGRRASFTIKARPSPKADDAHDTVAEPAAPAQEKANPAPVLYPRSSGTLPPLGKPQTPGLPADPTRVPFAVPQGKVGESSRPFPAPAPAKSSPFGKVALVLFLLIGVPVIVAVGGYFGYDMLRSKFTTEPAPSASTVVTPPVVPPVVSNENPVVSTTPDPKPNPGVTTNPVPTPPPATTGNTSPPPPPPPPPPPVVVGIPPPSAEVAADPKVQTILESLSDHITLMKIGKAEQPTLLIRNIRYEVGKTVNEEHKLRYLGVQPNVTSPDKKEIVFEDGRGARYKLVF